MAPIIADGDATSSGTVILELLIDPSGAVIEVRPLKRVAALTEPAIIAARQWRYQPTLSADVPAWILLTATLKFPLEEPRVPQNPAAVYQMRFDGRVIPVLAKDILSATVQWTDSAGRDVRRLSDEEKSRLLSLLEIREQVAGRASDHDRPIALVTLSIRLPDGTTRNKRLRIVSSQIVADDDDPASYYEQTTSFAALMRTWHP